MQKIHAPIRAILFDCNGIISDDEPIHMRLFQKVLAEEKITLSREEYYDKYLALDDRACFTQVLQEHKRNFSKPSVQKLIDKKADYYQQTIASEIRIFPGVKEFVKRHQDNYPMGVVSGALRHEIDLILTHAGIISAYSVIVSTEDVKACKPDPEGYLLGWKLLNALPQFKKHPLKAEECLVIEDSVHGVQAAIQAGMKCMAVTNSYPADQLTHASTVVHSLKDVHIQDLTYVR